VIVRCANDFRGSGVENIIVGNTVLFGAIAGEAYFNGVGGERFCVRNSGAAAVVEGVGDHGCEYMTGGTVVVLGETGRNFAAGMSGGVAYVYDPKAQFAARANTAMVDLEPVLPASEQGEKLDRDVWHAVKRGGAGEADEAILKRLIENHFKHTGSLRAKALLENWDETRRAFVKVMPKEYRRALKELAVAARAKLDTAAA
jgi:glutamate synthase (NADPH/NADH) large chain